MASINTVILSGNLTRAPELRYTPKGTAVAELGVAVNRQWTDDAGQKHEEATFVDVTAWGKTAEATAKTMKKGGPVLIEGRLNLETWDDKATGQKRSKLTVTADRVHFLWAGPKREE